MKSVRIKATQNTIASGEHLTAGKSYEVSESDAKVLCQMGKAVASGSEVKVIEEPKSKGKK